MSETNQDGTLLAGLPIEVKHANRRAPAELRELYELVVAAYEAGAIRHGGYENSRNREANRAGNRLLDKIRDLGYI